MIEFFVTRDEAKCIYDKIIKINYEFKQNFQNLLKQDQRFYLAKKDHFFKNKITECASNLDEKLIELLCAIK